MNLTVPNFASWIICRSGQALCVALVLLGAAAVTSAIPLKDYRTRLHDAQVGLTALMFSDNESVEQRNLQTTETVTAIRHSLPRELSVEWEGGSTNADNSWLDLSLEQLESIPVTAPRRNDKIVEITERLTALDARLDEIEKAQTADRPSRDEAKARMAEILRRKEYATQVEEEPAFNRLLNRVLDWLSELLRKLFRRPQPLSAGPSALIGLIARLLVFVLAAALIGYVLWKLIPHLLRAGGRKRSKKRPEARVVLGETLEADQSSADIWAEAEKLAREGNIRAAIRKGYIALLCELGDRKVVGLAQHKTNRDYLNDVHERRALFDDMRQMTNSYEYHWYGDTPATGQDWDAFRVRYRQALTHG